MVVDTSAVIAFLRNEPEAGRIEELLAQTDVLLISAVNVLECRTVLERRFGAAAVAEFERFLAETDAGVEAFDAEQSALAFEAYRRFGKGSGHPAQLNLGDCAAYALAKTHGLPLLFKGEDFSRTDVLAASR